MRHRRIRNVLLHDLGNSLQTSLCLFRSRARSTELGIQFFELLFAQQPRAAAPRNSADGHDIILLFVIQHGTIGVGSLLDEAP